ncbi:MAG: hypothetical protein ACREQW_06545 [Candidatus Binatia bacterium]
MRDLTKEFVTDERKARALAGVNFEVRDGEFFGIIGPTGCGKPAAAENAARARARNPHSNGWQ